MNSSTVVLRTNQEKQQTQRRETLPESSSLLLDLIRFTAAIMVFFSHFTHPKFALGFVDRHLWGEIAVPVFFVLSGFVIRYVTRTREATIREYFVDRASRVYSVVLPALVFTFLVIGLCFLINRGAFLRVWPDVLDRPLLRIGMNLTFVNEAWGHEVTPSLNPPFWSLGFECIYYLLYGFLFYLRGWKRVVSCALVALVIGPQVLFLFPIWWLGCWLYDFYIWCRSRRFAAIALSGFAAWLVLGVALSLMGHRSLLLAPLTAFEAIAGWRHPLAMMGLKPMRGTMFAVATGIISTVFLFLLLLATNYVHISRSHRWARGFRYVANGTFTIYLLHFPFIVLMSTAGLLRPMHYAANLLIFIGMGAVMTVAAGPMDGLKRKMRQWLHA